MYEEKGDFLINMTFLPNDVPESAFINSGA